MLSMSLSRPSWVGFGFLDCLRRYHGGRALGMPYILGSNRHKQPNFMKSISFSQYLSSSVAFRKSARSRDGCVDDAPSSGGEHLCRRPGKDMSAECLVLTKGWERRANAQTATDCVHHRKRRTCHRETHPPTPTPRSPNRPSSGSQTCDRDRIVTERMKSLGS